MLWNQLNQQPLELGWDFYVPVLLFVLLCALAVPIWASIGVAAIAMLLMSRALPLSLVGESLFDGIDAFALTAIPLFILTGDVLVRTGLSRKFLDVAEALTCWTKGGFGSATVLVCGMFSAISGSDAAGAAAVGRMTIDRLVESGYPRPYACALVAAGACTGILIPPSIAYIIIGLVLGIAAVLGDIIESSFKRRYGIKDTGGAFPGHGGVLDRLDGFLFAVLALAAIVLLLQGVS